MSKKKDEVTILSEKIVQVQILQNKIDVIKIPPSKQLKALDIMIKALKQMDEELEELCG